MRGEARDILRGLLDEDIREIKLIRSTCTTGSGSSSTTGRGGGR